MNHNRKKRVLLLFFWVSVSCNGQGPSGLTQYLLPPQKWGISEVKPASHCTVGLFQVETVNGLYETTYESVFSFIPLVLTFYSLAVTCLTTLHFLVCPWLNLYILFGDRVSTNMQYCRGLHGIVSDCLSKTQNILFGWENKTGLKEN